MMQLPLFGFTVSLFTLMLLLLTPLRRFVLDRPNHRSLHSNPIPRTGGLALMAGVLSAFGFAGLWEWIWLIVGLMLVCVADDVKGVPAKWRLMTHLVIGALFAFYLLDIKAILPCLAVVLTITWMANLYNFMDGSDGLAGGMALIGFGTYAVIAYLAGDFLWAMLNASIAAAAIAFLLLNFHPAKIFMGDTGSIPLGFLAGAIGWYGYIHGLWALWLPVLVFSPFIMDATVTLLKRIYRREKVWEAHRSHYYQRLVQMGWGHRRTAITEYMLMIGCSGLAVALHGQQVMIVAISLICVVMVFAFIMFCINRRWKNFAFSDFR